MEPKDIAVFVGSLRQDSLNRKMARALAELAPASLALQFVEIGQLPLFNEDLDEESQRPAVWSAFRRRVKSADAVLFVTPEYNRSVPAVLKNAIDVGSRPYGENAWQGKPGAVVSVSPGAIGGFGANYHLRQSLVFLDVAALPQPEVCVGGAANLFDAEGRLINQNTRAFLRGFMLAFDRWIDSLSGNTDHGAAIAWSTGRAIRTGVAALR